MRPLGFTSPGKIGQVLTVTAERLSLGSPSTLTVASSAISVSKSWHRVDSPTIGTTNLATINGAVEVGQLLLLQAFSDTKTIKLLDASGNLELAGAFSLDSVKDTILLIWNGTTWVEICRSNN